MQSQSPNIDYKTLLTSAYLKMKELRDRCEKLESDRHEPIAIVGMSCRFPGARDIDEYWQLLRNGISAITEVPASRWDADRYYDADPETPGMMYTRHGGFIDDVDRFDAKLFGISPKEANYMDPQQRLLLELSYEALESACIPPFSLKNSSTGVFMGLSTDDYEHLSIDQSSFSTINPYSCLGTARSIAAGRLAYVFGLQGPVLQVDTACSSSLLSVHLACQHLRDRECNLALAGGINLILSPGSTIALSKLKALSKDGKCRTFDADADGYVRGEGGAVIVLKRLSDAIASKDRIFCLIKGSATNHDGESNGLTAPNGLAQEKLFRKALDNSSILPSDLQYVEAHGTGTPLGDPIEAIAIGKVYGQGRAEPLYIGSVKTNIGHLEAGAGIASLIKVVLSINHGQIPPSLHFNNPNPYIPWNDLQVKVIDRLIQWPASAEGKKTAAVSAFGLSGTNVHLLVQEAPAQAQQVEEEKKPLHRLLAYSAATEEGIEALQDKYIDILSKVSETAFADICYSSLTGRTHFPYRQAMVCLSARDALDQLERLKAGAAEKVGETGKVGMTDKMVGERGKTEKAGNGSRKIGFLFTGQGSQYINMGRELYQSQPLFGKMMDICSEIATPYLGQSLTDIIYSDQEDPDKKIDNTLYTQVALFAIEYALSELWKTWGIVPDIVMGHSVGEFAAACTAKVFSLEDGLKLIVSRGKLMSGLSEKGAMLNVFLSRDKIEPYIQSYGEQLSIAAINGPEHLVLSGKAAAIDALIPDLKGNNIRHQKLNVSHAFHSQLMVPMLSDFETVANAVTYRSPQLKIVSNTTGQLITDAIATPAYWVNHVMGTVLFEKSIRSMEEYGCQVFIEMGPQPHLTAMARSFVQDENLLWLPSLSSKKPDSLVLLNSLRELYCGGVNIDWNGYFKHHHVNKTTVPFHPMDRKRFWIESRQDGSGPTDSPGQHKLPACFYDVKWSLLDDIVPDNSLPNNNELVKTEETCLVLIGHKSRSLELLSKEPAAKGIRFSAIEETTDSGPLSDPEQLFQLFSLLKEQNITITGIVHHWEMEQDYSAPGEILQNGMQLLNESICNLVKVIERSQFEKPPKLWLISRSAVSFHNRSGNIFKNRSGNINILQAGLWGLTQVLRYEHPDLETTCIDLEEEGLVDESELLAKQLILGTRCKEAHIAFREGKRWGARLSQLENLPETKRLEFSADHSYLVTGGFGWIGRRLIEWMVESGARHIISVGRSEPGPEANSMIAALRKKDVLIYHCKTDIADMPVFSNALEEIRLIAPAIKGIFHLAGIIDDGILLQLTREKFQKVLSPKVAGAWNLHLLSLSLNLDFFVSFSSVASLIGSPGQANYAVANAFLDALAHYRRFSGLPGMSVNWGPWEESTMAGAFLRNRGEAALTPFRHKEAFELLQILMRRDLPQAGAFLLNEKAAGRFYSANELFLSRLPVNGKGRIAGTEKGKTAGTEKEGGVVIGKSRIEIHAWLTKVVGDILGYAADNSPSASSGFAELGMDSLMAVELRNNIKNTFDYQLSVTAIFNYPTIDELTDFLTQKLNGENGAGLNGENVAFAAERSGKIVWEKEVTKYDIEQLTEEEAEALLEKKLNHLFLPTH